MFPGAHLSGIGSVTQTAIGDAVLGVVAHIPVLFIGPPGTGKTTVLHSIMNVFMGGREDGVFSVDFNPATPASIIEGTLDLPKLRNGVVKTTFAGTVWDEQNSAIIFDEITRANPGVMEAALTVLDAPPAPILAACNYLLPRGSDRDDYNRLEALFDRFMISPFPNDPSTVARIGERRFSMSDRFPDIPLEKANVPTRTEIAAFREAIKRSIHQGRRLPDISDALGTAMSHLMTDVAANSVLVCPSQRRAARLARVVMMGDMFRRWREHPEWRVAHASGRWDGLVEAIASPGFIQVEKVSDWTMRGVSLLIACQKKPVHDMTDLAPVLELSGRLTLNRLGPFLAQSFLRSIAQSVVQAAAQGKDIKQIQLVFQVGESRQNEPIDPRELDFCQRLFLAYHALSFEREIVASHGNQVTTILEEHGFKPQSLNPLRDLLSSVTLERFPPPDESPDAQRINAILKVFEATKPNDYGISADFVKDALRNDRATPVKRSRKGM